ncbi:MAG: VWA domain-containing protein [Planctomycetes bacterium]|nr:VWA domain-containing protein [Planctomycetota bacterium]
MLVVFVILAALFGPAQSKGADPIARAREWIEGYGGSGTDRGAEVLVEGESWLAELAALDVRAPERRFEIALALLDCAGLRPRGAGEMKPDDAYQPDARTKALRASAVRTLEALLATDARGELARELAVRVMIDAKGQPLARRVAAIELFTGKFRRETELALLHCADSEQPVVSRAALRALAGWPEDAVHRRMARELEESLVAPGARHAAFALRHFETTVLPNTSTACPIVERYLARGATSSDWRVATRALRVAPALSHDDAVPVLIAALTEWVGRRAKDQGSSRIEGEIARELERRSKRHLGPYPERWRSWWRSYLERRASGAEGDPEPETVTSFFGLRPTTDRVVFVLDRSGSMDGALGTGGTTRWKAAVAQLLDFVEKLGPTGRFRVILFSDETWSSSRELKKAVPQNIASLRNWLSGHRPGGGTELQPAIREALAVDERGALLGALDADSVVVLCDGQTAEGPAWVEPFLESVNPERCIVFYCVQIGGGGDGTLATLALRSGGQFVQSMD